MNKKLILLLLPLLIATLCCSGTDSTTASRAGPVEIDLTAELATLVEQSVAQTAAAAPTATPSSTPEPSPTLEPTPFPEPTATAPEISSILPPAIPEAACLPPGSLIQEATVIWIADGDTVHVSLADGSDHSVRYIGIDTPETGDALSQAATEENTRLVNFRTIIMARDVSETDPHDRLLRYVFVDNTFVNLHLVRSGYATAVDYPPDTACSELFHQAEEQARAAGLGIWAAVPTADNQAPSSPPDPSCTCTGPDLDCGHFATHDAAQACYDYCVSLGYGNVYKLDGEDGDGQACETLP